MSELVSCFHRETKRLVSIILNWIDRRRWDWQFWLSGTETAFYNEMGDRHRKPCDHSNGDLRLYIKLNSDSCGYNLAREK